MSVGTDLAYCTLTGSQLAWCRMAMKGKSVKQLIANVQEDLRNVLAIKSKEQSKEPLRQRDLTECCRVGNVQGETLLVTLVPYRIDFREIRLSGFRVPGHYSEPRPYWCSKILPQKTKVPTSITGSREWRQEIDLLRCEKSARREGLVRLPPPTVDLITGCALASAIQPHATLCKI